VTSHPDWPHRTLDVATLRESGWRPTPFRQFVFKIHQLCNLACDYCYVYELTDRSWRDRPRQMAETTWRAAIGRILEHVRRHELDEIGVVLHGGEPLLTGLDGVRPLIRQLRAALADHCTVRIGMQTNGTLLDRPTLDGLRDLCVRVGVSLDGTAAAHDRHRVNHSGRGSFPLVQKALALLSQPEYASVYSGLLCVIDPTEDPIAVYESLLTFRPPAIDLLLPHANWAHPPPRSGSAVAYGDWLCTVFDRWYDVPHRETSVRLFDELLVLLLGGASRSEHLGLSPSGVVVVESDGAMELVDSLKSAYSGAAATGLNVFSHSFDQALEHPGVVARQIGPAALGETCQSCPVRSVCGGGHYAHRYREPDGFRNPSVYCADLRTLIEHAQSRVVADLARLGAADR
jgi:uncharacterized protein